MAAPDQTSYHADVDDRAAIRELVRGQRAAAKASAAARRETAKSPQWSLDAALELWDLRPELFDAPPSRLRRQQENRARAAWRVVVRKLG